MSAIDCSYRFLVQYTYVLSKRLHQNVQRLIQPLVVALARDVEHARPWLIEDQEGLTQGSRLFARILLDAAAVEISYEDVLAEQSLQLLKFLGKSTLGAFGNLGLLLELPKRLGKVSRTAVCSAFFFR